MWSVVFLIFAYILGSIPFSYLLGKVMKGQDIRQLGSGNLGTTNAFRVFGKLVGILVMFFDIIKAGLLVYFISHTSLFDSFDLWHPLLYGFASVLGHIFPIWFRFKGGKGVACSFGLLLAYSPLIAIVLLPVFIGTIFITKIVSVASMVTALSTLLLAFIFYVTGLNPEIYDITLLLVTLLSTGLIFWKHRSNIERLKQGTENKVKIGKKQA